MQSEEVIQMLNSIIGNPNKKDNTRRSLKSLRQKTTDIFVIFFSQFRIYTNFLKLDKETMIDKLKDKFNLQLKDAIAAILYDFNILKQLSNFCQQVDNQQHYISKKYAQITAVFTRLLTRLPSLGSNTVCQSTSRLLSNRFFTE